MAMTYRELRFALSDLTPEQMDQTATIFIPGADEYFPLTIAFTDEDCDALDPDHCVLTPE